MQRRSRYNELANSVLRALSLDMRAVDLSRIREIPVKPGHQVAPPSGSGHERRPG